MQTIYSLNYNRVSEYGGNICLLIAMHLITAGKANEFIVSHNVKIKYLRSYPNEISMGAKHLRYKVYPTTK